MANIKMRNNDNTDVGWYRSRAGSAGSMQGAEEECGDWEK
jgi:hypothetical protein